MNLTITLASAYAGAALPAKKNVRGANSRPGIRAQAVIEHHDVQRVEQLALVFVDALDLAVENGVGIDHLAGRGLEPVREAGLGFRLT